MKPIRISGMIVLLAMVIAGDSSAAELGDLFEESVGGAFGAIVGQGLGVSFTVVIASLLGETEVFYPFAMATYHAPVIAGSALGVYVAGESLGGHDGSFLWAFAGSSIPILINMIYVGAIEKDKVYEFFEWKFGIKCRGSFPGIFFSPIGAVIGYELSRSSSSQQKKEQSSGHVALYIPLFGAKF